MPHASSFVLIAPGLDLPAREASTVEPDLLARMAGRGRLLKRWPRTNVNAPVRPWQRGLLDALGLSGESWPSAPLSALGYGLIAESGFWMHAEAVHFAAGLDRLTFVDLARHAPLDSAERAALSESLAAHFPHQGFTWHASDELWFVRSERALDVVTSTPDAASSNELSEVMPRGQDSTGLRRLMTELQMILHEHPVNVSRERRGLPAANAVWFWGAGSIEQGRATAVAGELPKAHAADAFMRGLYRFHDAQVQPLREPQTLLHSLEPGSTNVVVQPVENATELAQLWLNPLIDALTRRRIDGLSLVLDEWHIQVDRGALRRFWRRPMPAAQWERAP
jgi:hypothetical protein